jgi:hypothetical protein
MPAAPDGQPCSAGRDVKHVSDPDWQTPCNESARHTIGVVYDDGSRALIHLCVKHLESIALGVPQLRLE